MTLKEIFNRVLVESGQFVVSADMIELDVDRFLVLVKATLGTVNKFDPVEKKFNLDLSGRHFKFTPETHDLLGNLVGIPERIVDLIPVRVTGVYPSYMREFDRHKSEYLSDKIPYPWDYRKPDLHVPVNGQYELHAIYNHQIVKNAETKEWECDTISDVDDDFFQLLTGKFLKGLGKSRRAFTLNELPITTDADQLVSEGQEMEDKAIENLEEDAKFWLGWS